MTKPTRSLPSSRKRGKRTDITRSAGDSERPVLWSVIYYLAADGTAPALEFLDACPTAIDAQFTAVLDAVAAAPPPQFSGGGKWEAMHGTMGGWYEIRLTGPGREQFRLFCLLENGTPSELSRRGLRKPAIAVITGMRKPWRTVFSDRDYKHVRDLGSEHRNNFPRRLAR
jgi:hypothetical protein